MSLEANVDSECEMEFVDDYGVIKRDIDDLVKRSEKSGNVSTSSKGSTTSS